MQAYSPLGGTGGNLLENEVLNTLAKKYGKSPAQIVIRWDIQRDFIVIPKSVHKDRIISNFDIYDFELSGEDMETINSLNCGQRFCPDPDHFDF